MVVIFISVIFFFNNQIDSVSVTVK